AEVAHALYRAYWVEGKDVSDRAVLAAIARAHGLDPEVIDAPATKERLRQLTDEAIGAGVFGAPSFLVTNAHRDALFFGQDLAHHADRYGVPYRFPSAFPVSTLAALRLVSVADDAERPRLTDALFRAYWAEDRDLADPAVLAAIASPELRARAEGEAAKAAL